MNICAINVNKKRGVDMNFFDSHMHIDDEQFDKNL